MPSPQDGSWSKEDEEASIERGASESSPQQNVLTLVTSALLKCGGQLGSSNHSGWTAMDTSFHRGWLASNVCSVAMFLIFFA